LRVGEISHLSFQYSLSNSGKSTDFGAGGTGGVLVKMKKMTITVDINTWSSPTTSLNNWYSEKVEYDIDGGASSIFNKWESYIAHGHLESHGQGGPSSWDNF